MGAAVFDVGHDIDDPRGRSRPVKITSRVEAAIGRKFGEHGEAVPVDSAHNHGNDFLVVRFLVHVVDVKVAVAATMVDEMDMVYESLVCVFLECPTGSAETEERLERRELEDPVHDVWVVACIESGGHL